MVFPFPIYSRAVPALSVVIWVGVGVFYIFSPPAPTHIAHAETARHAHAQTAPLSTPLTLSLLLGESPPF